MRPILHGMSIFQAAFFHEMSFFIKHAPLATGNSPLAYLCCGGARRAATFSTELRARSHSGRVAVYCDCRFGHNKLRPVWGAAILAAGGRRWNGGLPCIAPFTCTAPPGRDGVPSPSACMAAYCNPAEQRTRKPGKIGDVLVARRISTVCCGLRRNLPICQYRHRSR